MYFLNEVLAKKDIGKNYVDPIIVIALPQLAYARPYSSLARDFDPLADSLVSGVGAMSMHDNSRSYLGGANPAAVNAAAGMVDASGMIIPGAAGTVAGATGLRDTAINSLDGGGGGAASVAATDYERNRYLASRRFVVRLVSLGTTQTKGERDSKSRDRLI